MGKIRWSGVTELQLMRLWPIDVEDIMWLVFEKNYTAGIFEGVGNKEQLNVLGHFVLLHAYSIPLHIEIVKKNHNIQFIVYIP